MGRKSKVISFYRSAKSKLTYKGGLVMEVKNLLHEHKPQPKPRVVMPVEEFNRWAVKRYHRAFDEYRNGQRTSMPIQSMYTFDKADGYVLTNMYGLHKWYPTRKKAEESIEK